MKKTTILGTGTFTIMVFFFTAFCACKKQEEASCFSLSLQQQSIGLFCIDDCPGVKGCDGNIYCNECYAAKAGMSVVK